MAGSDKYQLDHSYNPAAEAFKTFDQDQTSALLGSLHLETEEEPRRGTSRANSVRFDESALHGHTTHTSRSSSEIFPVRVGSAFGSHPMTERSSSHKSEGRQSSAGQSTHSTRLSSLANESRPPGSISAIGSDATPGLLLLGPLPSIIRCWLDTRFSNDSLLYAAVCTGSFRSAVSRRLVTSLYLTKSVRHDDENDWIKLPVYFPEATVQQPSIRSTSPAPQLPALTVTFQIIETNEEEEAIEVFLGSDVLRLNNADIFFSQSRMTIYDDDNNKLTVPLVRPEKPAIFNKLTTCTRPNLNTQAQADSRAIASCRHEKVLKDSAIQAIGPTSQITSKPSFENPESYSSEGATDAQVPMREDEPTGNNEHQEKYLSALPEDTRSGTLPISPARLNSNSIWTTWRRDASLHPGPDTTSPKTISSSSHSQAASNKGMKVLRPARMGNSRSVSTTDRSSRPDGISSNWSEARNPPKPGNSRGSQSPSSNDHYKAPELNDMKHVSQTVSVGARPNPAGGASAFGWLNSAQRKYSATSS